MCSLNGLNIVNTIDGYSILHIEPFFTDFNVAMPISNANSHIKKHQELTDQTKDYLTYGALAIKFGQLIKKNGSETFQLGKIITKAIKSQELSNLLNKNTYQILSVYTK